MLSLAPQCSGEAPPLGALVSLGTWLYGELGASTLPDTLTPPPLHPRRLFVERGGVELLLALYRLPRLPPTFGSTNASHRCSVRGPGLGDAGWGGPALAPLRQQPTSGRPLRVHARLPCVVLAISPTAA